MTAASIHVAENAVPTSQLSMSEHHQPFTMLPQRASSATAINFKLLASTMTYVAVL